MWIKSKGAGFEAKESLHMCSLLPKRTIDRVIEIYSPTSWLDVGCGTGAALKYINRLGLDGWGVEYSALAIKESGISQRIMRADLTQALHLKRRFGIVWCYEVAEHLPDNAADVLIDTLCRHSDIIILSAAVPGQGGEGHINEQPKEYWIGKMAARGYMVDQKATSEIQALKELFSGNLVCYRLARPDA
jgi:2-polyprenyl-3-methyl-5-hydroxy-6-metoxy-1,4-benzoquinol methylase